MNLRKYLIMGSQNCDRDPVIILEEAINSGITAFQFREKGPGSLNGRDKLELGRKLRSICKRENILFLVNDDVSLVDPLEADGIHVGQDDISVVELRRRFPDKLIGLSVSNDAEVANSPIDRVDYFGAGPIFPTSTKHDAKSPVGLEWIEKLKKLYPNLPVVGIGGINTRNASSVMKSGADGVAVISAVTRASNIKEAVERL
ncbi:thiamine phosphate synthase [Virgibacillus kekensis]|uniref:Thiamine-phosphate synthase n=1 Tax=Virgibacillus kekensis TaxID=202261 RepID=A0ABV9DI86_9BACI